MSTFLYLVDIVQIQHPSCIVSSGMKCKEFETLAEAE